MEKYIRKILITGFAITLLACFASEGSSPKKQIACGKEDSGGGGGVVLASKEQVEKTVNDFLTFFKAGEKFRVARFFYGPYSRVLNKLTAHEQVINGDTLKTMLHLNKNKIRLSTQQNNFFITFVNTFIAQDKSLKEHSLNNTAFFPDLFSFVERFDHERLKKEITEAELIFDNCALRYNMPTHKLASYFFNNETQHGELCFDSENLTKIGPINIELQIAALLTHEIVHMYFDKNLDQKQKSQETELSAQAMQDEFFNYYADAQKVGYENKTIQTFLSQILNESEKICHLKSVEQFRSRSSQQPSNQTDLDSSELLALHASLVKTQMLTLLLDSYILPISAYLNRESNEFEFLQISEFLSHFNLFHNKQPLRPIEKLREFYCEKDPIGMNDFIFNDYITKYLSTKLKRLKELDAPSYNGL